MDLDAEEAFEEMIRQEKEKEATAEVATPVTPNGATSSQAASSPPDATHSQTSLPKTPGVSCLLNIFVDCVQWYLYLLSHHIIVT